MLRLLICPACAGVLLLGAALSAQTTGGATSSPARRAVAPRAMTNTDIVKMVAVGLGEDIIIGSIGKAQRLAFDLSPDGLVKLKEAGVTDRVLAVMLSPPMASAAVPPATAPRLAEPPKPKVEPVDSGEPAKAAAATHVVHREPGIYLAVQTVQRDFVPLEPAVFSQAKSNNIATRFTFGLAKTTVRAVVHGARAGIRTPSQRPIFYFYFDSKSGNVMGSTGSTSAGMFGGWMATATSPNEFVLVQMYEKPDSRELVVGELNFYTSSSGTRSADAVSFKTERLAPGEYRVTPSEDLGRGEFCFFYAAGMSAMGNGAVGKLFDFGVDLPAAAKE